MQLIIRLFGLLLPLLLRVIMDRNLQRFMIGMITFTTAWYCDNFQKRVEWGYRIKFPGSFPGLSFSILIPETNLWLFFRMVVISWIPLAHGRKQNTTAKKKKQDWKCRPGKTKAKVNSFSTSCSISNLKCL